MATHLPKPACGKMTRIKSKFLCILMFVLLVLFSLLSSLIFTVELSVNASHSDFLQKKSDFNVDVIAANFTVERSVNASHSNRLLQKKSDFNVDVSASNDEKKDQKALKKTIDELPETSSPYAIVWVVGAVHEDRPAYKGFIYDVLISARILRQQGSTSDLILWVQISPDSRLSNLPDDELRFLTACDVQVRLLENGGSESFARLVYDKFKTIQMVEYKRVMFLDADMIPTINMDYLFHLSDPTHESTPTILRPNLIMATRGEPCNTAFFIVEPNLDNYNSLLAAIKRTHEAGRKIKYPHFDWKEGWGHDFIKAGDQWKSVEMKGVTPRRWRFHAGHSDQGLMYYYAKYLIQDTSIAIGNVLQNWGPGEDLHNPDKDFRLTLPTLLLEEDGLLTKHSPDPFVWQHNCNSNPSRSWNCPPPYRNFAHFAGDKKPWQLGNQRSFMNRNDEVDSSQVHAPYRLWFKILAELNQELGMGLDVEHWNEKHMEQMKESPLGYMAMYKDHTEVVMNKK